jgi:hypothetical protein
MINLTYLIEVYNKLSNQLSVNHVLCHINNWFVPIKLVPERFRQLLD